MNLTLALDDVSFIRQNRSTDPHGLPRLPVLTDYGRGGPSTGGWMTRMQAKVVIDGQEIGVVAHFSSDGWLDLICHVRSPIHWRAAEARLILALAPKTIDWLTEWGRSDGLFVRSGQVVAA